LCQSWSGKQRIEQRYRYCFVKHGFTFHLLIGCNTAVGVKNYER
jgi:hypothetical protein